MAKLIRWETPFTDKQFPSVGLLIATAPDMADILKAVVAPHGLDEYPKYLVNFGEVVAFTCMEEAHAPERDFDSATFEDKNLCAYQYLDSPWLKSYEGWELFFAGGRFNSFSHYLIFGADNNVEVITPNVPTIEVIKEKTILRIVYEV
jgi:hypothetical protein